MAAMIDVVFLLLIFFLTTTSFIEWEYNLDSQLPQVGKAIGGTPKEDFDNIRIRLTGAGDSVQILVDSNPVSGFDELVTKLQARRAIADASVIIEGTTGVPFRYMVSAMDSCFVADLHKVAFSASELK